MSTVERPWLRRFFVWVVAVGLLNGVYVQWLVDLSPADFWLVDLVTYSVVPVVLLWQAIRHRETSAGALGFRARTDDDHGGLVLAALTVTAPLGSLFVYGLRMRLTDFVLPGVQQLAPMPWHDAAPAGGIGFAVAIVYLSLSAGLIEELAFRAVLFQLLPARLAHSWSYIAVSAMLFGTVHWEQGTHGVIAAAIFGVFMAVLFRSSRNIWPCVVGHTVLDLVVFGVLMRVARG